MVRSGDRVVALEAVVHVLAHITRREYSKLVAAVRALVPSPRWYIDTSLTFVHDRRDVPDYLARVLYSSLVVCGMVREGAVALVELLTDDKYAAHRDALAMRVTFNGKDVGVVEYDRWSDSAVVVVPRGNVGPHFVLTRAKTYGDVWLSARGYEATKGRVTSDVTYMNVVVGEEHDIYPLPTHETHYVLVVRERHGARGYEYTVPVRAGRLHDMQSDGVAGLVARESKKVKGEGEEEHGRTHVIPAPGALSLKRVRDETERARDEASLAAAKDNMASETRRRLWLLMDVILTWELHTKLKKENLHKLSVQLATLHSLYRNAAVLSAHITRTLQPNESMVPMSRADPAASASAVLSKHPEATDGEEWSLITILGMARATASFVGQSDSDPVVDASDEEAKSAAEYIAATVGETYEQLLAAGEASSVAPTVTKKSTWRLFQGSGFGELNTFALCDGVPYKVHSATRLEALDDDASGGTHVPTHCVYFHGELVGKVRSRNYSDDDDDDDSARARRRDDDDDVSVLARRRSEHAPFFAVIHVPDAMDLLEKTKMYVSGTDRPLVRLSGGAVKRPLVTYLCAYGVASLMRWYQRYHDPRYQRTDVLSAMPAALVVVDKELAVALDHIQAGPFSCGPRVARALVRDVEHSVRMSVGQERYNLVLSVALAYQRSEFATAPYVAAMAANALKDTQAADEALKSYELRVNHARMLARSVLSHEPQKRDVGTRLSNWEWLDVDGETDEMRTKQRAFRDTLRGAMKQKN